jgi:hypothetical protein
VALGAREHLVGAQASLTTVQVNRDFPIWEGVPNPKII